MHLSVKEQPRTILAVDDDDVNLSILEKTSRDAGYSVKSFLSGEKAWDYLTHNPHEVNIALIDKMMPDVNGIELLTRMKSDHNLQYIPVIIQTGDVGNDQMCEGLNKGAYYYLAKPFPPKILTSLLGAAENECNLCDELRTKAAIEQGKLISLQQQAEYHFRNHREARILAASIAQATAQPELNARGLMEIFYNAIEHGNLELGYNKKREHLLSNCWRNALASRFCRTEYRHRFVRVKLKKVMSNMQITVTDQGNGFNWQNFMRMDMPLKLNEPNGRGIAIANRLLNNLHYNIKGNEVSCYIPLNSH